MDTYLQVEPTDHFAKSAEFRSSEDPREFGRKVRARKSSRHRLSSWMAAIGHYRHVHVAALETAHRRSTYRGSKTYLSGWCRPRFQWFFYEAKNGIKGQSL
jgi:hypothetical protein